MKVTTYQMEEEKLVLTGMILGGRVLGQIHGHVAAKDKPFRNPWSNTIAGWCLNHFAKHQKPPHLHVQDYFNQWAERHPDDKRVNLIEDYLVHLNANRHRILKGINQDYVIGVAERYFNKVRAERLAAALEADPEQAQELLAEHRPISLSAARTYCGLEDVAHIIDILRPGEPEEILIQYPHGLGEFFGRALVRDELLIFMGPEKRGKSFWLLDLAYRAVQQGRRTLLYQVGDMGEKQFLRRLIPRIIHRPYWAQRIAVPTSIVLERDGGLDVDHKFKDCADLSSGEVRASLQKFNDRVQGRFRWDCRFLPTTVGDIRADVSRYVRDGWTPDVIVIDFADNLAAQAGSRYRGEFRHATNESWLALREVAHAFNCLVVSATQASAGAYKTDTVHRYQVSEDKRKQGVASGMIGLGQSASEKSRELWALNWIVNRHAPFSEHRFVHSAGCLAIANPAVRSVLGRGWEVKH